MHFLAKAIRQIFLVLRSALFYAGYVPFTIVTSLSFVFAFPFLPPRGRFLFASLWAGFVLWWLRLTCGVRWQVRGLENLPANGVVILANHQSSWETLFLYRLVFPLAPILKQELLRIPFFGWALALMRPIAIDRSNKRGAGKSLLTQGQQRLKDGFSVIVFPEGTRTEAEQVGRFSRGGAKLALAAGVPVLPIALRTGHCWPPRRFLKFPGLVDIEIGAPIASDGHDAGSLTDTVEHWIRERVLARQS